MKKGTGSKRILVISPHLDDAVLDCADHILQLKRAGHYVKVLTVFTKFADKHISSAARTYMYQSGFKKARDFERFRKLEDKQAMNMLQVDWQHLNFTDGWFRTKQTVSLYPENLLFQGHISKSDSPILQKLSDILIENISFDSIYTPMGVGGHTDHQITRKVSENVFSKNKIHYYLDFPYALDLSNLSWRILIEILMRNKSIKFSSVFKKTLLLQYSSQLEILFNKKDLSNVWYPEIILH